MNTYIWLIIYSLLTRSRLDSHAYQVLHEEIQTYILGKVVTVANCLVWLWQRAWIDLCFKSTFIGVTWPGNEVSGHWESFLHDILCVFLRSFQQTSEILEIRIILVTCLLPLVDGVTLPNAYIEECINKKNDIVFHWINI